LKIHRPQPASLSSPDLSAKVTEAKSTPAPFNPVVALFPDFKNNGVVVKPGTENTQAFSMTALRASISTPASATWSGYLTFIEGANQWMEIASVRAERLSEQLGVPLVVIHNASFVREHAGENWLRKQLHRLEEGLSNILLNQDIAQAESAKNVGKAMFDALESKTPTYFAGESQGSILVGHGLRYAKEAFVEKHSQPAPGQPFDNPALAAQRRRQAEELFEERAGETLNILTFGNAYAHYPDGPNYVHVSMHGDPVPNNGTRPDNHPEDAKTHYVIFDQLFPGKNNFENHNIAFLMELLHRTFELNDIPRGDLQAFFETAGKGELRAIARPDQVDWPDDMEKQTWDSKSDVKASLATYRAAHPS